MVRVFFGSKGILNGRDHRGRRGQSEKRDRTLLFKVFTARDRQLKRGERDDGEYEGQ